MPTLSRLATFSRCSTMTDLCIYYSQLHQRCSRTRRTFTGYTIAAVFLRKSQQLKATSCNHLSTTGWWKADLIRPFWPTFHQTHAYLLPCCLKLHGSGLETYGSWIPGSCHLRPHRPQSLSPRTAGHWEQPRPCIVRPLALKHNQSTRHKRIHCSAVVRRIITATTASSRPASHKRCHKS